MAPQWESGRHNTHTHTRITQKPISTMGLFPFSLPPNCKYLRNSPLFFFRQRRRRRGEEEKIRANFQQSFESQVFTFAATVVSLLSLLYSTNSSSSSSSRVDCNSIVTRSTHTHKLCLHFDTGPLLSRRGRQHHGEFKSELSPPLSLSLPPRLPQW